MPGETSSMGTQPSVHPAELLAKCADPFLRRGNKVAEEAPGNALDHVVRAFSDWPSVYHSLTSCSGGGILPPNASVRDHLRGGSFHDVTDGVG